MTCYGNRDLRKYVLVEFPEEAKDSVINNPNISLENTGVLKMQHLREMLF